MKTSFVRMAAMAVILVLGACGSDGDPGPVGEQGLQGPQGEKGDPGSANVIYSPWMPLLWNGFNDPDYKTMRIPESRATADFLEKGGVILFYLQQKSGDDQIVVPLPYRNGEIYLNFAAQIISGESVLGVIASSMDGSTIPTSFFDGIKVRYILVPGGISTSGRSRTSYEAVKARYHIPD